MSVQATSLPEFTDIQAFYDYGDKLVFQANAHSTNDIAQIYIVLQPASEQIRVEKVIFDEQGKISFTYDLKVHSLRPFARITYWFRAKTNDEKYYDSEKLQFDYIDNREVWQSIDDGAIQVNWLQGDLDFGQDALNSASAAAKSTQNLFPGQNVVGLRIYIYDSAVRVQEALYYNSSELIVGQANPDLGIVLISISPGDEQRLEMDRQIPHELMHFIIYQMVGDNYANVPLWLNEGLASLAETFTNPDYQRALKKAAKENNLMPMAGLCVVFPQDASGAFLGYAQSASFLRFLQAKYGNKSLFDLVNAYKNGYSCEDGVQAASGSSLNQLDYRWRQETLGLDVGLLAVQNLAPYLLVLAVLLVLPFLVFVGRSVRK
ncbi:MAG: peptidase MA family metallohydrolase [Saprospiraceae bacterium]|nr:peptidase MA family metallohydrolase [Saprospiraceae bacterium]